MVSHHEFPLQNKHLTPKNVGDSLGSPQRKLFKEALLVKYEKNKNVSLLSDPTPIKSLPEGKNVLPSLISPSIKEVDCSDAWIFVARHCKNGSSQIKGIDFDQS